MEKMKFIIVSLMMINLKKLIFYFFITFFIKMTLFLVISDCDLTELKKYNIVKLIAIINNAYLVEKINSNEREWVMKYSLYPLINHSLSGFHTYYNKYQKLIPDNYYLNKNNNQIEIINDYNNNPDYIKINLL